MYRDPYRGFQGMVQPVSYDRHSTIGQRYHSADRQTDNTAKYAVGRGWNPPIVFSDGAISGRKKERPGLNKLWEYLSRHPHTPVIVEDLSRLARSDLVFAHAIEKIYAAKAIVYDVENGYLTPSKLLEEAAKALQEHQTMMRRTQDGHDIAGAKGKLMQAPPYGYRRARGGGLVADPLESEVVRRIFEAMAQGTSSEKIARELEGENIPSPRGNKHWSPAYIRSISRNTIYAGYKLHRRRSYVWDVRLVPDAGGPPASTS